MILRLPILVALTFGWAGCGSSDSMSSGKKAAGAGTGGQTDGNSGDATGQQDGGDTDGGDGQTTDQTGQTGQTGTNKPGGTTASVPSGKTFFLNVVTPMLNANCQTCHADPRQNPPMRGPLTIFSYTAMKALLAQGASATSNGVFEKIRNIETHGGGDRCSAGGADATPCKEIAAWWHAEYGEEDGAGSRGKIVDVSSIGRVTGYAFDPADATKTVTVTLYLDGPKGTGAMVGTATANIDGVDASTAGAHAFSLDLPETARNGKPHMLYGYATIDGAEQPLSTDGSGKSYTAYAFTTAGRAYYEANVKGKLSACTGCHTVSYEQQFYSLLSPAPSAGGTAGNNLLINKPAQINGVTHGGGSRCASATASPCADIAAWWKVEFGG